MAAGAFAFSVMSLFVKLAGVRFSTHEIVFFRSAGVTLISGIYLLRSRTPVRAQRPGLLVFRSLLGFTALVCFYYAISRIPLADVTVIQYTNPVFAGLLAAWFLEERPGRREGSSTLISLVGVLLVTRPGFLFGGAHIAPVDAGIALSGAILSGAAYVTVRKLGETEDPMRIVFWFAAISTLLAAPVLANDYVAPVGIDWLVLGLLGVFTHLGQIFITWGLRLEPAGRATSVGYLQIVFAALWGVLFFGEVPGLWSLVGAALIVVSVVRLGRKA